MTRTNDDQGDTTAARISTADLSDTAEASERDSEIGRIARQFVRGKHGYASLSTGVSSALRRMDPERPSRALVALMPVLDAARVPIANRDDDLLRRWATIVHIVAILSGTTGAEVHSTDKRHAAGRRMHEAGYSDNRLSRLLAARGSALTDQARRLARFLAAKRMTPIDLAPLVNLLLSDGRSDSQAEEARFRLARDYYRAADGESRKQSSQETAATRS